MESITSRSNPLCAHLRKLAASAAHRRGSGEFLCDSPKLLEEVLLWRRELLRTVLCTDPGKLPELPEGTRVVVVPESLMEYLSPARTPQGVLSLCRKPEEAREKIVALMGDLPRVELFARQSPPGWDVWGNEVEPTIRDFGTKCPEVQKGN